MLEHEHDKRTVAGIRRLQDAINYQRGVAYALGEVARGGNAKEMFIRAVERLDELLTLAEKENATKQ